MLLMGYQLAEELGSAAASGTPRDRRATGDPVATRGLPSLDME